MRRKNKHDVPESKNKEEKKETQIKHSSEQRIRDLLSVRKVKGGLWKKYPLHEHHVYGGTNRTVSEENGFKVYLCLQHHIDGPEAVHNNIENTRIIQRDCQETYEKTHTRQQFMDLIGRNYL